MNPRGLFRRERRCPGRLVGTGPDVSWQAKSDSYLPVSHAGTKRFATPEAASIDPSIADFVLALRKAVFVPAEALQSDGGAFIAIPSALTSMLALTPDWLKGPSQDPVLRMRITGAAAARLLVLLAKGNRAVVSLDQAGPESVASDTGAPSDHADLRRVAGLVELAASVPVPKGVLKSGIVLSLRLSIVAKGP